MPKNWQTFVKHELLRVTLVNIFMFCVKPMSKLSFKDYTTCQIVFTVIIDQVPSITALYN